MQETAKPKELKDTYGNASSYKGAIAPRHFDQ